LEFVNAKTIVAQNSKNQIIEPAITA